jgi:hypothetical protein
MTCSAGAIGSAPTAPPPNSSTADWLPRANGNKRRGRQAHVVTRNLFPFNGYFGHLNYGKNIIALFEVHPLDRTSRMDVTVPAAVRITISDTTLSETIFSIVPANPFRTLVLTIGLPPQFA